MALPCRRAIGAVLISSLLFFTVEKPAITLREGVLVDFYEGLICDAFLREVVPVNNKKKVKIGCIFFLFPFCHMSISEDFCFRTDVIVSDATAETD